MQTISGRLLENNIELTRPVVPVANYVQTKTALGVVFVSGQLPSKDGDIIYKGRVGKDVTFEQGKAAAALCMINVLNQLSVAVEDSLEKVVSCIKLDVFISCEFDFERHSEVANGASDLLVKILGERGRHVRVAIGVTSLPLNSAVEVSAIFETIR